MIHLIEDEPEIVECVIKFLYTQDFAEGHEDSVKTDDNATAEIIPRPAVVTSHSPRIEIWFLSWVVHLKVDAT